MPTRLQNKRLENKQWKNMSYFHHGQKLVESLPEPFPGFHSAPVIHVFLKIVMNSDARKFSDDSSCSRQLDLKLFARYYRKL